MFFKSKLFLSIAIVGLAVFAVVNGAVRQVRAQEDSPAFSQLCVIQSEKISENSGVAHSNQYENAIWTHNDSGGKPIVYLVSTQTGETLVEVELANAKNKDWEDIDSFRYEDKNYLLVADVGDNQRKRKSYQLCVFTEPEFELENQDLPRIVELDNWKDIRFEYEDGPCNCEAVAADMNSNQIILLEKVYSGEKRTPGVYFLQLPGEKTDGKLTAARAGDLPLKNITAMTISADGNKMVVRTYVAGYVYTKTSEQTWPAVLPNATPERIALPVQRQSEGICFTADDSGVICSSEFCDAPLWLVRLQSNSDSDQPQAGSNEPAPK